MSAINQHADGISKVVKLPVNYGIRSVTVNGGAVTYTVSSDNATVTLDALPAAGTLIVVTYNDIVHSDGEVASLFSTPTTPQVLCSPITGDGDLTKNESISLIQGNVTGFITPQPGIISEVRMITQRTGKAAGSATPQNVRWSICSVEPSANSLHTAGIKIGEVLATGIASIAPSALGNVALATGLSVAVPKQFAIIVKAPFKSAEADQFYVQNCLSGGMIAGVFGSVSGNTLVSAATYTTQTIDLDATTPATVVPGDGVQITSFKGLSVFCMWKKA